MYTESSPGSHQALTSFVPILCYTSHDPPETEVDDPREGAMATFHE
jgi:hypothetical protein